MYYDNAKIDSKKLLITMWRLRFVCDYVRGGWGRAKNTSAFTMREKEKTILTEYQISSPSNRFKRVCDYHSLDWRRRGC
jgi:hypothetical protein